MALIQKHEGIIHKVIGLYIDNEEDKRDLKQEILLQGWRGYQNFKAQSSFSTWLYRVALNTVLSHTKKAKKEEGPIQAVEKDAIPAEDHELLYQLIKTLNDIDRMLITLHLDGYKHKEISEITGMTANHVTVKIHRLKAEIIHKFKKIANV